MSEGVKPESLILLFLTTSGEYSSRISPYLKSEYFKNPADQFIFDKIRDYSEKYHALPSTKALELEVAPAKDIDGEPLYLKIVERLKEISKMKKEDFELDWVIDQTETFCRKRAVFNAVTHSISVFEDPDSHALWGGTVDVLRDAISIGFNTKLGHDYLDDAEQRFDYYHAPHRKIPFNLVYFNKITNGGLEEGTINLLMAGTHVGKTLVMCNLAAGHLLQGYNVLYFTLEENEMQISKRVDANLLDVEMSMIDKISREKFLRKIGHVKERTVGKMKIGEFPTSTVSSLNFQQMVDDLKLKQGFVPQIVYIDYIGICASASMKFDGNSYQYFKKVAEEVRAFGKHNKVPIITAAQTNRSGQDSPSPQISDMAESHGISAHSDLILGLSCDDSLRELGRIQVKQLKNRYTGLAAPPRKFVIGFDTSKMRLYDIDDSEQIVGADSDELVEMEKGVEKDKPLFDNSRFGKGMKAERRRPGKRAVDWGEI